MSQAAHTIMEAYSYDPMGRIAAEHQCTPANCSGATNWVTNYAYDLAGDMISSTNGAGVTLTYSINVAQRLTQLNSSLSDANHPGTLLQNVHYGAFGMASDQLGNGAIDALGYAPRGWLQSLSSTAGATTLYSFGLTFAPDGNVLTGNDSVNGNWTYSYDDFNRLLTGNATGQAYSYVYDRFGNRWNQNGPHPKSLGFDANNRIASGYGVTSDAAGNVANDGSHSYTYNAENQVIWVDSGATAQYLYDAEGHRIRKIAGGTTVDYIYDTSGNQIAEFSSTGSWNRGEVYAGGHHVATYAGNTTYFIHADWLGTERARSSASGAPFETCTSLPFGDWLSCAGTDPSPMHFTGKERDAESGLDNFGARYNSSSVGRFMSPDPLLNSGRPWVPQSWNHYSYARNNPLNIVDPTGLYDLVNNCAADNKKCNKQFNQHAKDLKNGLSDLQKKVDKMKDGPEKQRLQAALTALGTEGDHNGVNATFGALSGNAAAETKFQSNDIGQLSATGTFDPSKISDSAHYAIDAAHEGTHIEDSLTQAVNDYIAHGSLTALSDFSGEYRGYQTSAWAASALGLPSLSFGKNGEYAIWNRSWGNVDDKAVTRLITETYKHSDGTPYVETNPHNPWDN